MKKSISMFMSLLILFFVACSSADYGVAPVYQGMELGNENTLVSMTDLQMIRNHFSRSENLDDIPIIEIPEQPDIVYYSARNEDVYVRVILDNPDSQVILRFTLNGVVYQSFEFEDGSNSELLIVKVNAGDVSGLRELTIDEIKYIENVSNETKDADFEGDRTITMAVTYEQLIEASVNEEVITSTSYRSVITISDPDNLSAVYENEPVFYLSDGTNIIYTQTLTNGNNIIEYPYLHPSRTYVYAVATTYDLLDGEGAQVRMAVSKAMTSEDIVSIEATEVLQEALSFNITPKDPNSTGAVSAIELYQGDTLVEALSDLSLRQFSNLLSNNAYEIRVTYTYDLNDGNGAQTVTTELSITTLAKATPIVEVISVAPEQEALTFDLNITDVDTVGSVTAIELYKGETLVESLSDLSLHQFSNLLSNNAYEIRVTYTYDLNDGNGAQTVTTPLTMTTLAKTTPIVEINMNPTQESVSFDLNITDVDTTGSVTAIELYQGETLVEALTDLTLRSFTGLLSNNAYELRVTYTYDLNDGVGAQTVMTLLSITTLAKAITIDSLDLLNTEVFDGDTVRFKLEVSNPDSVDVQSVVINGVTIDVDSTTTTSTLKFRFEVNGSMETLTYIIEEFILVNGQRLRVTLNNILEVIILPNITIEDVFSSNMKHYGTMEDQSYIIVFEDPVANSITGIEYSAPNEYEQSLRDTQINILDDYMLEVFMNSTETGWVDFKIKSINILINSVELSIDINYYWRQHVVLNETPISITTPQELRSTENGYLYELTNDLDFSEINWDAENLSLNGVLLGNNFKIINFSQVDYNTTYYRNNFSLFHLNNGVINDLIIEDLYFSIEKENYLYVSGMAILNTGVINNSKVTGEIDVKSNEDNYISGFVNTNYQFGKLLNLETDITVTNVGKIGYIAGIAVRNFGLIDYTKTKIIIDNNSSAHAILGGITSENYMGSIIRSEVDASIKSYSDINYSTHEIGGITGVNQSTIMYSLAKVNLETSSYFSYTGGIVGRNEGQVYNCISYGLVNTIPVSKGSNYSGGFVGENIGVIKSSYSKVQTSVDNSSIRWSGGFVGGNNHGGSIENSFSYSEGFNDPFVYSNNGELKDNFTSHIEDITELEGITYLGSLEEIIEAIMQLWDQNIWDFTDLNNPSLRPLVYGF